MHWYAINTKPHQERVAELHVRQIAVETFCPWVKQRKPVRRRWRTVIAPLFPGYLFAKCDLGKDHRGVSYARGVRGLVTFGAAPAVVSEEIIRAIQARQQEGYVSVPAPSLEAGDPVRVREGPLEGLEAVFERRLSDRQRVVLLLRTLAYQARVIVPAERVVNL